MKITIGPTVRAIAVQYWARFHEWPPGLLTILRGAPVPDEIRREAEAARMKELADQKIRDERESGLLESEEGNAC